MNSLLVETRVKSTLYAPILYWSGTRHWVRTRDLGRALEEKRKSVNWAKWKPASCDADFLIPRQNLLSRILG